MSICLSIALLEIACRKFEFLQPFTIDVWIFYLRFNFPMRFQYTIYVVRLSVGHSAKGFVILYVLMFLLTPFSEFLAILKVNTYFRLYFASSCRFADISSIIFAQNQWIRKKWAYLQQYVNQLLKSRFLKEKWQWWAGNTRLRGSLVGANDYCHRSAGCFPSFRAHHYHFLLKIDSRLATFKISSLKAVAAPWFKEPAQL